MNATTWTSAYGRERALGYDGADTLGRALGNRSSPHASFGFGGLTAYGTGRGAGGSALGTIGVGLTTGDGLIANGTGSGYGSGAAGFRARDPRMPRVRTCSYRRCDRLVNGALAKDVIRRVVHQRLGEVRYCYQRALVTRPDLTGRISIDFVVGPSGSVQAATVRDSDLHAPELEQCIARSVRRWAFPQPRDGGMVQVNYPFTLTPDS